MPEIEEMIAVEWMLSILVWGSGPQAKLLPEVADGQRLPAHINAGVIKKNSSSIMPWDTRECM